MSSSAVDWERLKNRLVSVCPSCMGSYYVSIVKSYRSASSKPSLYLLKYCCLDKTGLLHGIKLLLKLFLFYFFIVVVFT